MSKIILPIKKIYSDKIFSGEKKYEFRKSLPKEPVETILVYESAGCGKIIGEIIVDDAISGDKSEIFEMTKDYAGISYDDFMSYFKNQDYAFAYVIVNVLKYENSLELSDFGLSKAPQNFVYIKDK